MERFTALLPPWLSGAAIIALAVLAALTVHRLAIVLIGNAARRSSTPIDDIVLRRLSGPSRWLLVVLALSFVQPAVALAPWAESLMARAAGLAVPALIGWIAIAMLGVAVDVVTARADISVADNLVARQRRTRAAILYRVGVSLILVVAFCMMLLTIPSVRDVGVTLIASAGLAGLAVGAAAQPALRNLIAGIQLAFTEPIHIDDVVIIDGEWGRVEEIRLTYVVVAIWDQRRLIVPISKVLENSFQNWTRRTSEILGAAFIHVDPAADVARIRRQLDVVVRANPNWDGRVVSLLVTDTAPDHLQLRALISAENAGKAFDLRCDVREQLMAFIAAEMPEAIPRRRGELRALPVRSRVQPAPSVQ